VSSRWEGGGEEGDYGDRADGRVKVWGYQRGVTTASYRGDGGRFNRRCSEVVAGRAGGGGSPGGGGPVASEQRVARRNNVGVARSPYRGGGPIFLEFKGSMPPSQLR
jgi:hypothetical protein